jgi:hypothetical protein
VSDQDIPTSGSRWEPAAGDLTTPAADAAVPVEVAAMPTEALPTADVRPARRLRGRSAVAAAGVGLVLAGGIGGFAVRHAVAGNAVSDGTAPDGTAHDGTGPGNTAPDTGGEGGTA